MRILRCLGIKIKKEYRSDEVNQLLSKDCGSVIIQTPKKINLQEKFKKLKSTQEHHEN